LPAEIYQMSKDWSKISRQKHPIPDFIRGALEKKKLRGAYEARPPYQQNDYIGWITGAKLPATREKRLAQMLDELERGDVNMKMAYHPKTIDK
jgi:uncharacterized protein YdeI (YjbR/CyaY-like superfamily)